ncbi:hypothetical protein D8771_13655 [Streptomyces albus]|uniref:Uncharacterized protein n=1 Tax=Streptomyces albus TaxID=1888 RepID=A0A8H1LGV9_9ACTN|nr:hypothetical protein ADL27_34505 [Streptomyces sp. NRRL F-6602]TGG83936.1 hypothetical protein D8771_13655 [Streptomyces albus]
MTAQAATIPALPRRPFAAPAPRRGAVLVAAAPDTLTVRIVVSLRRCRTPVPVRAPALLFRPPIVSRAQHAR